MSWGFFLAEPGSVTSPGVDIVLGGQVQERWPRQLFVDPSLGAEALDYFLETGKQKETLHWIRTDAVPRETVWEGRAGGRRGKRARKEEGEREASTILLDV